MKRAFAERWPCFSPCNVLKNNNFMRTFNVLTRRSFLDRSLKIGMGVALGTLADIPFIMKRALAEGTIGLNGKKLLFIFLRGANDSLNSVIPIVDSAYNTDLNPA